MKVFSGLERILRFARARRDAEREAQDDIGRAAAEGNPRVVRRLR
jgi:hypothetical protein